MRTELDSRVLNAFQELQDYAGWDAEAYEKRQGVATVLAQRLLDSRPNLPPSTRLRESLLYLCSQTSDDDACRPLMDEEFYEKTLELISDADDPDDCAQQIDRLTALAATAGRVEQDRQARRPPKVKHRRKGRSW